MFPNSQGQTQTEMGQGEELPRTKEDGGQG